MTRDEMKQIVTPIPMPLGIITSHLDRNVNFEFTRPTDRQIGTIGAGTRFTIWNWANNAYAAAVGEITEISQHTAAGVIMDTTRDDRWPAHIDPCGRGMPVYLLAPDHAPGPCLENLLPDPNRLATLGELEFLLKVAEEHREATGIPIHGEAEVRKVIAHYENHQGLAEPPPPPPFDPPARPELN